MPNWVSNKLTISGDKEYLDELQAQMATPYETEGYDYKGNKVEYFTKEGVFLLWNAIRPTDLDAYHERAKLAEEIAKRNNPVEEEVKVTPEEMVANLGEKLKEAMADPEQVQADLSNIMAEMAVGMDWYNWNVRNWGTKWEIGEAVVISRTDRELIYGFETAWSPPAEALSNLAKQYPSLTFVMRSLDENDCFACELAWADGESSYDLDLPITHEVYVEMHGGCYACDPDEGYLDDSNYDDLRVSLGCLESATAGIEAENV